MEGKKSNIGIIICIIIIVLLVIALAGMFYYYNFAGNKNNITSNTGSKILKIDNSKDLVYTAKAKVQYYNYNIDDMDYKDVDVIQVNLNNDNIKALNEKIIKYTQDSSNWEFDTKYYLNDDILSIVLTYYTEGDPYYFFVFNIDTNTGNILTNEELLYNIGLTDNLTEKISDAVYKVLDENKAGTELDPYGDWYFMSEICNDFRQELKVNIPMFLNENGKLSIIVSYCTPAGSGGPWGVIVEL